VVWDAEHPREMAYRFGHNPCRRVVVRRRQREPAMTDDRDLHPAPRHTPLLVSLPHVGTHIPETSAALHCRAGLQVEDTDWFLDRLYAFAGRLGASLLVPRCSRYVVDLNRPPDNQPMYAGSNNTELCPTRFFTGEALYRDGRRPTKPRCSSAWPPTGSPTTTRWPPNWRACGAARPRGAVRRPQHQERTALAVRRHAAAHEPGHRGRHQLRAGAARRRWRCWPRKTTTAMCVDGRFKGGHITRHYGRPADGVHAVQLEMCWRAYMDEAPPYRWHDARAPP
jgi:N-formylglutamate deformylase